MPSTTQADSETKQAKQNTTNNVQEFQQIQRTWYTRKRNVNKQQQQVLLKAGLSDDPIFHPRGLSCG